MTVTIELTRDEMVFAALGGVIRNIDALLKGRRTIYGDPYRDLWANNVTGAMSECAAAKHFGRYWTPCYDMPTGVPDLGRRVQIRSSLREDAGLRVYERDKLDHAFILVIARPPRFSIVGWLYGREVRRDEWAKRWGDGREGTWEAPQRALRPIEAQAREVQAATSEPDV